MTASVQISVSALPRDLSDLERLCLLARAHQMTSAAWVEVDNRGRVTVHETAEEAGE